MTTAKNEDGRPAANLQYIIVVTVLTLVLPVASFVTEHLSKNTAPAFLSFGKWFIFSAVGLRLFLAGFKQATNPAFTAKEIFHLQSTESHPVVRELGFANLCFGLLGIVSFFKPEWRTASAFASGLYYGMATFLHIIKKPAGTNETVALVSDLVIFLCLLFYCIKAL